MTFKISENLIYKLLPNIAFLVGLISLNTILILLSLVLSLMFKIALDYFTLSNKEDLEKKIQDIESDVTALKFQGVFKK